MTNFGKRVTMDIDKKSFDHDREIEADNSRRKIERLALPAKKEEGTQQLLMVTAQQHAAIAKEKENIRRKLAVTAEKLRVKALQLAITAKEKEAIRGMLAETAKELAAIAREKEVVRRKLAVTAKENEQIRQKLALSAKELNLKIQQQLKIEKRLKESETRYRRLFETSHDGILILDFQTGQITDVNPFLNELLGYSKNEFLSKKLWEIMEFGNVKKAKDAFNGFKKGDLSSTANLLLVTKAGHAIEAEFVSNSYLAGETQVVQCNVRDITNRKKIEHEKESHRLLEEERLKIEAIADANHELRTPLAIIKGNVELAMRNQLKNPKPPISALRAIDYEVKELSKMLSDLTLITSNRVDFKNRIIYTKVNLKLLLLRIVKRCTTLAYKKHIVITADQIPNLTIYGSKPYLEKMFTNLIKNSIDHGKVHGHTKITMRESAGIISITISDDGIGIPEEDLPHIFERFYRANKFQSSAGSGTGLGLAIVKWIAEIHDGDVGVSNLKDKGSVFKVSLPIKAKTKNFDKKDLIIG